VKFIVAVIQPARLHAVRDALVRIGVERMSVSDALGFGRQRGQVGTHPDRQHAPQLLRKVALEIVVNDDFLQRTLQTIQKAARTGPEGNIGDGKIFVLPAIDAIQLGGTCRGPEAV